MAKIDEEYLAYISNQLSDIPDLQIKKMFGGIGVFKDKVMFGMMARDNTFRLKADASTQAQFETAGMKPFAMQKGDKVRTMPYWEVPTAVIEDQAEFCRWALRAWELAVEAKK